MIYYDDDLFPAEKRRQACIHEAAHAVIYATGDIFVERLLVRPEGPRGPWIAKSSRDVCCYGSNGLCCADNNHSGKYPHLFWDDEHECFVVNNNSYKKDIKRTAGTCGTKTAGAKYIKEERRRLRVNICSILAGPIADAIAASDKVDLIANPDRGKDDDLNKAEALCMLLPYRNEYDFLATETERLLRTPEVWDSVLKLADALNKAGTLGNDDDIPFLPDPIPTWPPSPYRRNIHD